MWEASGWKISVLFRITHILISGSHCKDLACEIYMPTLSDTRVEAMTRALMYLKKGYHPSFMNLHSYDMLN